MSTTISTAGVILKDVNGNVGKVNGLTDNDVATVNSAISAINKIAPSGSLPDASADTKGVVYAATKGVSVVQPESGKTYALTTESTDQLVTIANAQTITGSKTFSDSTTFDGRVNATGIYLKVTDGSQPISCYSQDFTEDTGTKSYGYIYGADNAIIDFKGVHGVTVPTVGTVVSTNAAASTEFVHNAIEADTTHAKIIGSNYFSGDQTIVGRMDVTDDVAIAGTITSGGAPVITTSTLDTQLTGKVIKAYPTATDTQQIFAPSNTSIALSVGLGAVDMVNASSVNVPNVYATIPEPTTIDTEAASISYVKQYVDNHASSSVAPVFVDGKGRDFSQLVANRASLDCSELIGSDATYATFDDLYTDIVNQNFDKIRVGQSITIPDVSWSYGSSSYTKLVLRVLDLRYTCFYGSYYTTGVLVMLDPVEHSIASAAHSSMSLPSSAYTGTDLYTTTLPAIYDALAGSSTAPLYNKISTVKFRFPIASRWDSSSVPFYYNGGSTGAVTATSSLSGTIFIPSASAVFGYTPPYVDLAIASRQSFCTEQIAAFRNIIATQRPTTMLQSYTSYWLCDVASSSSMAYLSINPYSGVVSISSSTITNALGVLPCFVLGRTS